MNEWDKFVITTFTILGLIFVIMLYFIIRINNF